jgi:hypothetical protein
MKARFNSETISLGKNVLNDEPISKTTEFLMDTAFGIYLLVMLGNIMSIITLLISPTSFFKLLFGL